MTPDAKIAASSNPYASIINGMTAGAITQMSGADMNGGIPTHVDSDSEAEGGEDGPFKGEDPMMPYHLQMKQKGITFNEWKDKKFDWDL